MASKPEYTIGWICALPLERAAARAMLDEVHGTSIERHSTDNNTYTVGRIGPHNVVIANLPAGVYGETPAATVAAQMLSTFPAIRAGLLVGIGGGIPSRNHDIGLGDVVVSRPEGTLGGVVQFDRGKTMKDGRFLRTGSLNKPPVALLNALADLEAEHELEDSKLSLYISEMLDKYEKMRATYSYQGQENDALFQAGYPHEDPDDSTCASCDRNYSVDRRARSTGDEIQIHYGTVASSNQVVKDAVMRDRIRDELGALCVDMEAAGLMDNFPCIVIRGICDYADTHKNKRWQRCAAASAAAYAKKLLYKVPARDLAAGPSAADLLQAG